MQLAKDERRLKDKSFKATLDSLVKDYDRLDPINASPNKRRIRRKKKNRQSGRREANIRHYFPWGSDSGELTNDINNFIIKEAKRYWKSFYNLMQIQKDPSDKIHDANAENKKFKSLKQMIATHYLCLTHVKHVEPTEMEGIVWHIGSHCHQVETLDISYINNLTADAVRLLCLGHFEHTVRRLIARRCLSLYGTTMKLIASRLKPLIYCDLTECVKLKDENLRTLMAYSSASLQYLCLSKTKLGSVAILAVAGEITVGQMKTPMKRLESFDISFCKRIKTASLVTLGKAVHTLRFLNLAYCKQIDDVAICSIAKGTFAEIIAFSYSRANTLNYIGNPHLKVLNLNYCNKIGDVAMVAIGLHCHEIMSISMAHCYKISNTGLENMSEGTPRLQTLNLTSCRLVNEHCLLKLCTNATVISLLILDNLQANFKLETLHSIRHLLHYATVATTFYGLKPIDDILYAKLKAQHAFFRDGAATHIQCVLRAKLAKKQVSRMLFTLQNNSSKIIGKLARQYILKKRVKQWSLEYRRQVEAATVINRNAKIAIAKMKAEKVRFFKEYVRHINLSAAKIQGLYRGFYGRHYESNCSVAYRSIVQLRLFLAQRKRERAATEIQKTLRGWIGRRLFSAKFEEDNIRANDVAHGIIQVQSYIRMFNAINLRRRLFEAWYNKWYKENKAAEKIQTHVRIMICKRIVHEERLRQRIDGMKRKLAAAKIRSAWLTYKKYPKIAEDHEQKSLAAARIQALYQGSKISHWSILKDLPYRRKVMNKMFMEATIARGKADNKLYLRTMQGDSASESDEDWEEYYDSENGQRFWWSMKENRKTYRDPTTNEDGETEWERTLIGLKCKVLMMADKSWIQATISAYNPRKKKHKFTFPSMDGGYEWINIRKNHERIMVRITDEDTSAVDQIWAMMKQIIPSPPKNRKKEKNKKYDYWAAFDKR